MSLREVTGNPHDNNTFEKAHSLGRFSSSGDPRGSGCRAENARLERTQNQTQYEIPASAHQLGS